MKDDRLQTNAVSGVCRLLSKAIIAQIFLCGVRVWSKDEKFKNLDSPIDTRFLCAYNRAAPIR
jgi:hypothetical protein